MNIALEPGRYVVAVSGGVDSMVLLNLLHANKELQMIIAHFDHGMRHDSSEDRKHVQAAAKQLGFNFVYDEGNLGPDASEASARQARYEFLHKVRQASKATAVVTAHHQDDLLETAIINLLRGTGRRGLSSLRSTDVIKRPLLHMPKAELIEYAKDKGLAWREDITNQDVRFKRNHVRHVLLPKFSSDDRAKFLDLIHKLHILNDEIDSHITNHLHLHPALNKLDRHTFIMLPHKVACEVMAAWLRKHDTRGFDKKSIERLVAAAKTHRVGQKVDVDRQYEIRIRKSELALKRK